MAPGRRPIARVDPGAAPGTPLA